MKNIEIKSRFDSKIIISGKYKSIKDCLEKNRDADLRGANLQGADLQGANLQGADLILLMDSLYSLKLLPENTKLIYWKYLIDGKSPYHHYQYEVGKEYVFDKYNDNENELCGEGGNVATLTWCLKDNAEANEFIQVEFQVKDIIAIPYFTDGKFRVKRFKVIKKYTRQEAIDFFYDKLNNKSI